MIKLVHKNNKTVIKNCIAYIQEVRRELSMLIRHIEDIKIQSNKLLKMKTTTLAKKNTETSINVKTQIY